MVGTKENEGSLKTSTRASDFQYDEDKPQKVFMMSQADEVREKVIQRHLKHRLPRKQGMYQLPTRRRSVPTEDDHFYHGHHWDVGVTEPSSDLDSESPIDSPLLNMQHTTRRLTICAVNEAVEAEQQRRTETEAEEMKLASLVLRPMNRELKLLVNKSKKAEKKKERGLVRKVEDKKEFVLQDLLHKVHLKDLETEENEERQRRMQRMEEMTDYEKAQDDKNTMKEIKAMSKSAKVWGDVRTEIEGAFHDLDDVNDEVDHAVDDLFTDLKDNFVLSFKHTTHLMQLKGEEEAERKRRLSVIQEFDNLVESDPVVRKSLDMKDGTQNELRSAFAATVLADTEEEERCKEESKVIMRDALQELLHVCHSKEADGACAEERTRRIVEAEEELTSGSQDPVKERVRDALRLVQEQMLLERFHGKKKKEIAPKQSHDQTDKEVTKNDEKLRKMRTKARRQSCVSGHADL